MLFFLIHKVTMGFAVIGVINGVLMQESWSSDPVEDRNHVIRLHFNK